MPISSMRIAIEGLSSGCEKYSAALVPQSYQLGEHG